MISLCLCNINKVNVNNVNNDLRSDSQHYWHVSLVYILTVDSE